MNQVLDECESTNDLARSYADQGAPHGTWISARKQSAGRGRLGRKWESLVGNLFLSILIRPNEAAPLSWVPIASAVAIAEFLRQFNPKLEIELKWPNDLWLGKAKVGGLLCEAARDSRGTSIVIGIGLNCAMAPEGLDQRTISLSDFLGKPIQVDEIRVPLVGAVLVAIDHLCLEGPSAFILKYEKLAAFPTGTNVQWQSGGQTLEGHVLGLGSSGELKVSSEGKKLSLYAEDVKLRAL